MRAAAILEPSLLCVSVHAPARRNAVVAYYDMVRILEQGGVGPGEGERDEFIGELSPSLQSDIKMCLFRKLIEKVPFLSHPDISTLSE